MPDPAPATQNKLVKTMIDAAILVGLAAGIGWVGKKTINQSLTQDPSNSLENYVKFTAVTAGCIYLKKYLEDEKIIPDGY